MRKGITNLTTAIMFSEYPETYKLVRSDNYGGKFYEVSNKYIRFGKPASEAMKEAGKIKAAKMRSARQNSLERNG